jgi:hypothetical protein
MHVVAQLIGYPRIGPNRELKRALERMWSGRLAAGAFTERVDELRRRRSRALRRWPKPGWRSTTTVAMSLAQVRIAPGPGFGSVGFM